MIHGAGLFVLMRVVVRVPRQKGTHLLVPGLNRKVIVLTSKPLSHRALDRARKQDPVLFMKTPERAASAGYELETHFVNTDDGYILGVHRIPGGTSARPVLLQHGLGTASDSWMAFDHSRSLAYQLVDKGFDVWMGNVRGNLYSRKHTTLEPRDPEFWKFSWHEMGMYDIPATVDYILNTTGHKRLNCVVYSMGNPMTYVLLSMKPEYNDKIGLVVSMSPAIFFQHMTSSTGIILRKRWNMIKRFVDLMPTYEMLPHSEDSLALVHNLCKDRPVVQKMFQRLLYSSYGETRGLDLTEIPAIQATMLAGHSGYTVWHFVQLMRSGRFQQFDWGAEGNQQRYGSPHPPEYDLKKITTPVAIQYGDTDTLVASKDVLKLSTILPNVLETRRVPSEYFNHLDFIAHKNLKDLLYDHVADILGRT